MQKNDIPKNIVWLDLEMTGLEPSIDIIIEVAVIATHFDLQELDSYESGVKQDEAKIRQRMFDQEFFVNRIDETEAEIQKSINGKDPLQVEQDILDLITRNFGEQPVYLAGNSIHMDRTFIKQYWPKLHSRLHYRMLDVSSFKLWYLGNDIKPFSKQEKHTALADIEESIAELKYYLEQ